LCRLGGIVERTGRLVVLDGLRGLAALAVMLGHVWSEFHIGPLFARSYLMVDLFFLLSGYVLTLSIEPRLAQGWGEARFLLARAWRLWPMIVAGVGVGAIAWLADLVAGGFTLHEGFRLFQIAALGLLLVPCFVNNRTGALFPLNGPHWSLLFEVCANVVHAFVLRRLADRWVLLLALGFGVLLAAAIYQNGRNDGGPYFGIWLPGVPRVGFAYCLGIWLARKRQSSGRDTGGWPWQAALAAPVAAVVALAALPLPVWAGDAAFVLLVMPVLFRFAAGSRVEGRAASALQWLGALSYPLYAVHQPILLHFRRVDPSPLSATAAVTVAVALAAGLAALFEMRRKRSAPNAARRGEALR